MIQLDQNIIFFYLGKVNLTNQILSYAYCLYFRTFKILKENQQYQAINLLFRIRRTRLNFARVTNI